MSKSCLDGPLARPHVSNFPVLSGVKFYIYLCSKFRGVLAKDDVVYATDSDMGDRVYLGSYTDLESIGFMILAGDGNEPLSMIYLNGQGINNRTAPVPLPTVNNLPHTGVDVDGYNVKQANLAAATAAGG